MTLKFVVVSMVLGLTFGGAAWAQVAGRTAVGGSTATTRGKSEAAITVPLVLPRGEAAPLTEDYDVLDEVSIFSRYHEKEPTTGPATQKVRDSDPVRLPRLVPVFRGVMTVDSGTVAVMEVPQANGSVKVQCVREGETFGGATVLSITFDTLRLSRSPEAPGEEPWIDVPIGCDLERLPSGALAAGSGTFGVTAGNRPGMQRGGVMGGLRGRMGPVGGAIANMGSDPPLPAGSADDLAGRMAARRQTQLGGLAGGGATATEGRE